MEKSWEQRLADRILAVAVASEELVEVVDPYTQESYYAPANRYPTVSAAMPKKPAPTPAEMPAVKPASGRHAAPKVPARRGTFGVVMAGFVVIPALAYGINMWSIARTGPGVSLYEPLTPDEDVDDVLPDQVPPKYAPLTEPASVPALEQPTPAPAERPKEVVEVKARPSATSEGKDDRTESRRRWSEGKDDRTESRQRWSEERDEDGRKKRGRHRRVRTVDPDPQRVTPIESQVTGSEWPPKYPFELVR